MREQSPKFPTPLPPWLHVRYESLGDYSKWLASDDYAAWMNYETAERYRERIFSAAQSIDRHD